MLAEEDRAAVAKGGKTAELVAGVRLRDRPGAQRQAIAAENLRAVLAFESVRIESERYGKRAVEDDKARLANRGGRRGCVEELRQFRIKADILS